MASAAHTTVPGAQQYGPVLYQFSAPAQTRVWPPRKEPALPWYIPPERTQHYPSPQNRPCAPPVQLPVPQVGPCWSPGWATSPWLVPQAACRTLKFPSRFPSRFPTWTVPQMRGWWHQGGDCHAEALHWSHCPWHMGTFSPARVCKCKSCSEQSSGVGSPQIPVPPHCGATV